MRIDYLLIGGGRTSANAAQAIRAKDPSGSIMIVAGEDRKPYDRPPLSKNFLEGRPPNPDDVESKADDFFDKHRVELSRGIPVDSIDPELKLVTLENGKRFEYGKLLIATGASPIHLDVPGADMDHVRYLRSVDDSMAIRDAAKNVKSAVLIGAGFVGTEVGATLSGLGVSCTILAREDYPWEKFLSEETGNWLRRYFEAKGVAFRPNAEVAEIVPDGVKLSTGEVVEGELVVVGIGVRLNLGLAKDAGLKLDGHHGIATDATLQTSDSSIWAAGDVAAYEDGNFGKRWHLEHYMNADWQGTHVGQNMAGASEPFLKVPYFFSDLFDLHFVLRGDPSGGDRAKVIGDRESGEFVELYAYPDGRLAMGLVFTRDDKRQDELGDKIEEFLLAKKNVAEIGEES
ncbi:MAG TPA: FAD-dependent oxidoreductase, partial [Fimbriimonadaceae bacterium]|nr:FAD-dependent oxidoreductase [Fimbriimonadaceae bacterium]